MILAIDSGGNAGFALFNEQTMVLCGLNLTPDTINSFAKQNLSRIIVERPHTGRTKARARDVLTLAIRAGEVGGVWKYLTDVEPEYIEPQRWKGQLPKKRCNEIVEAKLFPQEKSLLNNIKPLSAKHNVLDAVGIGLYAVGRWII